MPENVVQFLGRERPFLDWESASRFVRAFPNCTVVEMHPVPESSGGVLIADGPGAEWRLRPDVGVVISAGDGVPLLPGETVAVRHDHGKRVENFRSGSYQARGEVRLYGCAAMSGRKAVRVPYWRSIVALVDYDNEQTLKATGKNVVIDRGDIVERTEGGIILPESATYRPTIGTIVSVGADVPPDFRPGMRVMYMANLMLPTRGLVGPNADGVSVPKNYGIIEYSGILAEVEE